MKDSSSGARLISKSCSAPEGEYYNYRTDVSLVERNDDVTRVDYVIKRHFSLDDGAGGVIENEAASGYVIKRQYGSEEGVELASVDCIANENALAWEGNHREMERDGGLEYCAKRLDFMVC